jgi:4-carboxymuconolactone decarboxylase
MNGGAMNATEPPSGEQTFSLDQFHGRIADQREIPERAQHLVSIVSSTLAGDVERVRSFIRLALVSGSVTPEELQEVMLAAAVYIGFPPVGTILRPAMVGAARDVGVELAAPLLLGDPAKRHERGVSLWEEVHSVPLRPIDDLVHSAAVEFVCGEVYSRPGLPIRDRRLIAIVAATSQGLAAALGTHVRSALGNGEWDARSLGEVALLLAMFVGLPTADLLARTVSDAVHTAAASSRHP